MHRGGVAHGSVEGLCACVRRLCACAGQLYGEGKAPRSASNLHENNTIKCVHVTHQSGSWGAAGCDDGGAVRARRFTWDARSGNVTLIVNGATDGVVFTGVRHAEIFPAIGAHDCARSPRSQQRAGGGSRTRGPCAAAYSAGHEASIVSVEPGAAAAAATASVAATPAGALVPLLDPVRVPVSCVCLACVLRTCVVHVGCIRSGYM